MEKDTDAILKKLGDVDLDAEDIIFAIKEVNSGEFNIIFNGKVNKDDAEGIHYQEAIAGTLGSIAMESPAMQNIVCKAFAQVVTEMVRRQGCSTDAIRVKIINEDEKPRLIIRTNSKYKS